MEQTNRIKTFNYVRDLTKSLKDVSVDEILKQTKNIKLDFEVFPRSDDYVQCRLCGKISKSIDTHLIFYHSISSILYKKIFSNSEIRCLNTVLKHASKIRINTRSIRLDTQLPDIEHETKFNINRIRAYKSTIERDVFCQECGMQDSLYDVHHVVPQRLYERYDLEQDSHDNLILLCKHCHSVYGQKLDDIVLDIFENLIKIKFLSLGEAYIKYLKSQEKSFLKRKPGAPAQYFIDKEDLELFAENSIVDIQSACEVLKMPMHIVKRFCRDYDFAFDISYEFENKKLNTKQCPCCNWSGAVKFSTHLLEKQDDVHKKFLEEFRQKYVELKSCEKVALYYSKFNFTKVIIKDLLDELGALKKLKSKEYCCPVCKVELKYIVKHFNETKDVQHNEFYEKLKNMYFVENKSMSLISKELGLEMNLVAGYLKQFI